MVIYVISQKSQTIWIDVFFLCLCHVQFLNTFFRMKYRFCTFKSDVLVVLGNNASWNVDDLQATSYTFVTTMHSERAIRTARKACGAFVGSNFPEIRCSHPHERCHCDEERQPCNLAREHQLCARRTRVANFTARGVKLTALCNATWRDIHACMRICMRTYMHASWRQFATPFASLFIRSATKRDISRNWSMQH